MILFFFKQKTAYELRISDWSSDVFSSDLSIFYTDDTLDNIANMAVGIGVGGFLGGIQGGWALRKAANSKAMEAERVGAYDPKGFERVRRGSGPIDDFLGKTWLGYDHELETS